MSQLVRAPRALPLLGQLSMKDDRLNLYVLKQTAAVLIAAVVCSRVSHKMHAAQSEDTNVTLRALCYKCRCSRSHRANRGTGTYDTLPRAITLRVHCCALHTMPL
jgi:hypothetical protein